MERIGINESRSEPLFVSKIAQEEELETLKLKVRKLWGVVLFLTLALAGLGGYGYVTLNKHNIPLGQLPAMQESLTAVGQRLNSAETSLGSLVGGWDGLLARVTTLEGRVNHNLQVTRKQARDLAAQMDQVRQQMQAELEGRTQQILARLSSLESGQDAERARVAHVESEISAVRQQVLASRQETGRDLAGLQQRVSEGEQNVATLGKRLERERVDFEATKNRLQEVAPGISFLVSRTNVSYQRFDGRVWLMPDRRTLWLRGRGVQEPVVFYSKHGDGPRQLVITRVSRDGVVGYLLLPVAGNSDRAQTSDAGALSAETKQ